MASSVRRILLAWSSVALLPTFALAQQAATVTGVVLGAQGRAVSGAIVHIASLGVGSVTSNTGQYTINIPGARVAGQTVSLTARSLGYKQQSVQITLRSGAIVTQNFQLEEAPAVLSQVVVTGEGTVTTTEKLGNRIDQVSAVDINKSNEPNVVEALAAKAPNVLIQSQSGDPGASVSMQIRGIKTLTGDAQPLFVVDGIVLDNSTINTESVYAGYSGQSVVAPNRISDLNPDDIESVSILKGAAAAAIYGSRAAQGVVLITTKSGKAGPTHYALRSSGSWDNVSQGYHLQTMYGLGNNGLPLGTHSCASLDCMGKYTWGPRLQPDSFKVALAAGPCASAASPTTCANTEFAARFPNGIQTYDHWGDMFETGHVMDNTLTVSGGDERRTFYLSANRMDNRGFVVGPKDEYARNTARLKATQMIGSQLRLGGNIAYVDTRGSYIQRGNNVSGIMLGGLRTPPEFDNRNYIDPVTGQQRSYRFQNPYPGSEILGRGFDNPFFVIYDEPSTSKLGRAYGNVDLDYNAAQWLTLKYTGGADYYNDERLEALPQSNSSQPDGLINRANFVNYVLDHNLTAIATHDFGRNIATSVTIGQNLNSSTFRQVYVTGTTLVTPQPYKLSNTVSYNPNDDETDVHRESYFGQLGLDLYNQLFLTAAVRNDGSSAFAQNSRRHTFPKWSAAWTWTDLVGNFGGKLDFGKLRLASGVTGREPTPYSTLNSYLVNQFYEYGGVGYLKTIFKGQGGLVSSTQVGNSNLKPEQTRETEAGLDMGLFGGLTDLGFTYYSSRTTDVIFALPLPPSSGYQSRIDNAATITNRGLEAQVNVHLLRRPTVSWDVGANWGRNRNRVESIAGGVEEVGVGSNAIIATVAKPGYPVGSFEGLDFARCRYTEKSNVVSGVDINAACKSAGAAEGAIYLDSDGYPIADPTNRILGSYQPLWTAGLRSAITFHKVQLSALLDFRRGGKEFDGTRGALNAYGTSKETELRGQTRTFGKDYYTQYTFTGPGLNKPVVLDEGWFRGNGGTFGDVSSGFIENSGFVKLREISVAYTFDQPWVSRSLGLSSFDVRVSGRNLHTWTNYKGIDPEMNLEGAGLVQGVDWFNNPQTRSFVFTFTLNR